MRALMRSVLFIIVALPLIILIACSDPQNAPTAVNEKVSVHGPEWNAPASANFHGAILASKKFDSGECRQCHGNQFDGGIVEVSCKTCHASFPHPAAGWVAGGNSQIVFLKQNAYNMSLTMQRATPAPAAIVTATGGLLKSRSQYAFIYAGDKMEGINAAPKWTDAATAACGTCHGLPPVGHNPFDIGAMRHLPSRCD